MLDTGNREMLEDGLVCGLEAVHAQPSMMRIIIVRTRSSKLACS
jgi:hypothetical protein